MTDTGRLANLSLLEAHATEESFDYEGKVWGGHDVGVSPTYLGALRLKYCLEDLETVRGQVLEVGCGAGGMARAIKARRPDLDVYGCDISRTAIGMAQRNPGGVTFELGDAYELPYKADRFAAVVMFDVLEHLELPDRAIEEIRRVLKLRGLFHLFVPCEGEVHTLHGLLARVGWRAKEAYGGHIRRFTKQDAERLLREQGFTVTGSRWSGHLLNQIVDVVYFTCLQVLRKNLGTSVEGYIERPGAGIVSGVLGAAKDLVAVLGYYESQFLSRIPGWGTHLTAYILKRHDPD